MRRLIHDLFDFDRPETAGNRLHGFVIEAFFVLYALRYCWEWGAYIGKIDSVLLPLGIAQYIDVSFLFGNSLALWNAAAVTALCALGMTRVWRPAYLVAIVLFHLQYVARYSLGEISHGSNLIGMGILGLGVAAVLFTAETDRRRFLLGYLYFFVGLGYTSAAVCKLVGTGLDWANGYHLWLWLAERGTDVASTTGAFEPNVVQQLALTYPFVGAAMLTFGLVAEGAAFLMWWRRFRLPACLALVAMHLGVLVSLNIFFDAATYLLLLLGLPWGRAFDAALTRLPRRGPLGSLFLSPD